MAKVNKTDIQWADYSVNPIRARNIATGKVGWHCERVSDGCKHCYSATLNRVYGTGLDYAADKTPRVEFFLDEKVLHSMLTFKPKPPFKNGRSRAAVFPFDMTDLFGAWIPDEWIAKLWDVFRVRGDVDWLILTKRAKRMREIVPRLSLKPLGNIWLGISAENQERLERLVDFLETPAAVHFLSLEPLLGPINLRQILVPGSHWASVWNALEGTHGTPGGHSTGEIKLDWVIVGGESGPGARPCDVAWIRSIKDQCAVAGVACFVKQLGAEPFDGYYPTQLGNGTIQEPDDPCRYIGPLKDKKGGDPSEWSPDLRVREFLR